MKSTLHPSRFVLNFFVVGLTCAPMGCGEPTATISGIVELDKHPMVIAENVRGTVVFQPANRQGPTLNGSIGRDGSFRMMAGSKEQVKPGVYIATVSAVEIVPPTDENPQPGGKRITPDKYASSSESGLRYVVKPGANLIRLQLESVANPLSESDETASQPAEAGSATETP